MSRKKCLRPSEYDEKTRRCRVEYGEAEKEVPEEYSQMAPKLVQGPREEEEGERVAPRQIFREVKQNNTERSQE